MTDATTLLVDVLICTYRRPELLDKALSALEPCATEVGTVRVIVVDNDVHQSAHHIVCKHQASSTFELVYLSQPVQNISLTRNLALEKSTAPWIALIDDDEVPDPHWLMTLLSTAQRFDADAVFAPVISEFDTNAPAWASKSMLFQRRRFATGTRIPLRETRTGNVMLRGSRLKQDGFRFDPELGLSGGEDSEFFERLSDARYRMVWCDEACVREWTPLSRTTVSWVVKRAFRIGSVEAYNQRRLRSFQDVILGSIKSLALLMQGSVLTFFWSPISTSRAIRSFRRAAIGAGFFYGLVAGPYREYRAAAPRKESHP